MTTPTYKIVQNNDLSLTVFSNDEKLLTKTRERWLYMMRNCKAFIPDHIMDRHKFTTRRFLITDITVIDKIDEDDKYLYVFDVKTLEVPNDKSIFHTIRDYYTDHSHLVKKVLKEGEFK